MTTDLRLGDSFAVLPTLPSDLFDSVVTDPPYHLTVGKKGGSGDASINPNSPAGRSIISTGFMGKKWDGGDIAFNPAFWREVRRVLKPGGHLVAFGGTRTYHRMACGIEDAEFEIRDQLAWVFGSGFPKSSNQGGDWRGWGTALKPAWEPICLARKPLMGTVAENLATHRTGAINIDECRIPFVGATDELNAKGKNQHEQFESGPITNHVFGKFDKPRKNYAAIGRWPANLCHDGSDDVLTCFPNSSGHGHTPSSRGIGGIACDGHCGQTDVVERDMRTGSAARFFYCAKASSKDRDAGCDGIKAKQCDESRKDGNPGGDNPRNRGLQLRRNSHPTVKPTDLMRWLCRLVTPPSGHILDPFMGSGSTGRGAILEGFAFTGIEREEEYFKIARARISEAQGVLFA